MCRPRRHITNRSMLPGRRARSSSRRPGQKVIGVIEERFACQAYCLGDRLFRDRTPPTVDDCLPGHTASHVIEYVAHKDSSATKGGPAVTDRRINHYVSSQRMFHGYGSVQSLGFVSARFNRNRLESCFQWLRINSAVRRGRSALTNSPMWRNTATKTSCSTSAASSECRRRRRHHSKTIGLYSRTSRRQASASRAFTRASRLDEVDSVLAELDPPAG